jgi:calreticulin
MSCTINAIRCLVTGIWKRPEIPNPDYKPDDQLYLYDDNAYLGFDLWQVKSGTIFDNVIITDDLDEAKDFAEVCRS